LDHDRVAGPAVPTNNRFSHLRVEEANNVPAEILNGHRQKENQSENKPNIAIVGDSMIKNINPRKLSRKRVNKFMFPGKRAEEIASEVKNINVQLHPTHVIIHAGTNNLPTDTGDQCVRNIKGLCSSIKEKFPKAKLGVSSIILRKDIEVSSKMYQVNEDLKRLCNESGFSFIDNSIVDETGLNNSKLHLSAKGSALLATRFIKFLNPDKQLNKQPVGNHVSSENFLRDLLNLAALTQTSMSQRRRTR
jgi:lysophospholipase L1-like esterase